MTMTDRDKRVLMLGIPAIAIIGIFLATSSKDSAATVVVAARRAENLSLCGLRGL